MSNPHPDIAVMMPADMGGAVALLIAAAGGHAVTNLDGRSRRTRALAAEAGVQDAGSDRALAESCNCILSIVTPDAALALAERMADAIRDAGTTPVFVDCNAVSPKTAERAAAIVEGAGGRFVDGGIIGPPPRAREHTRFYASGRDAQDFADLLGHVLDIRVVGDRVGDASAVKMCYAAFTKGSAALMTQLLVVSERLGVSEVLLSEFAGSQTQQLARMRHWVPGSVPKAFRWVPEMQEIARTFAETGVTPKGFEGAAATFAGMAATEIGQMRVEEWAASDLSFEETVRRLAAEMDFPDTGTATATSEMPIGVRPRRAARG